MKITPEMLPLVSLSQGEIDQIVASVPRGVANIQDIYPLGPLQEGILFHHLLESEGDAYIMRSVMEFDSRTRLDGFLSALQAVIDRHDILRSAVRWQGLVRPVQVVYREATLPVQELSLSGEDDALSQLLGRTDPRRLRLDLERAPLLAAYVAADAHSGQWLLALLNHHMVSDHVTLELIVAEIQILLQGQSERLPLPLPYRNFIAQVQAISAQEHETYFRQQLGDVDEPTAPFGVLNIQGDGGPVEEANIALSEELAKRIRESARQQGVTPAVLFHIAWGQVLAQCSGGRDDVVFGTVLSGRLQGSEGADRVLGMFINTLPIRIPLAGVSVREAVRDTYQRLSELLEHEQASLALAQRCSGVAPPLPLFTALLNYRHSYAATPDLSWEGMRVLRGEERTNYPFVVSVDDLGQGFGLTAQCVRGIDPLRIATYLQIAIEGLVDALTQHPQQPVHTINIVPAAERHQVLVEFNATKAPYPSEQLVHQLFEEQVVRNPQATAVVYEDEELSYAELNARANQLAHHLIGLGVGPDDRVAICVERSLEMVVGLLGILKAGGAYVPLDPSYPAERLAYMLLDSAPVALLTQVAVRESLPAVKVPLIVLDGEQDLSTLTKQPDHNPDPLTLGGLNSHHLAYVIYTSGSTGTPKGVMNQHSGVVNRLWWAQHQFALTVVDRVLQKTPFGFDVSVWEFFMPLLAGAQLVIARPSGHQDPAYLAELIKYHGITITHFVPSMLKVFLDQAGVANCCGVRHVLCSGETLPHVLQARFHESLPKVDLHNLYGPTEAAVDVTYWHCTANCRFGAIPIGRPIANTQIYILDDYGQPVPVGVTGELYIGGVQVARGYLNRPELTAERFIADPFGADPDARMYKTGDLGRWLADGNIEYLGRNDFQVKIRGFRIELGEIEAKLAEHEGVREAVVIAREDSPGQKHLVAYVVVQAGVKLSAAELRSHLAGLLPEYMVPSAFVNLEGLPLTPNGKLDRRALPAPGLDAVVTRRYEAPQGVVETAIARVWQELLNLDRVGRHDHFFELGGHSLMVISLIERLRQQGISADVRTVFSAPTLAALATAVVKREGLAPALVVPPNRITIDCATLTPEMLPLVSLSQGEIDQIVASVPRGVANIQDIYPLGPLQEGILFHHLLESEGDAYIMRSVMEFDSRTRLDGFLSALQAVIDRHDILRSAVRWQGLVRPVQVVYREATLPVQELSLSGEDDALSQLLGRTDPRRLRLDLERAPLLAAYVAADAHSGQWLLALLNHHMVSDHVTLELIVAEIQILLQGQSERLPLPLPYRNFIAQVQAISAQEHETYFRQQLGDVDEPTAPFGVLNIQGDGGPVEEANIALSEELAKRIRESARQQGVTPAVLFHIAWGQVLAQCSGGRDDVVFGTVLSGRLQGSEGADRVLGMFINTLPIRIPLAGVSVREAVRDTYQRLSELLEHEQASLALAQRCSGVAPPLPLFTALLNYRHSYAATPDLSWEGMRVLRGEERTNYPLDVSVDDLGQGFGLTAQCVRGIDPLRIATYLQIAIEGLVDALTQHPQQPVHTINIVPAAERHQVLVEFNATKAPYPSEQLVHQLFEEQVVRNPQATAVVYEDEELSYAELNARANQLAHHLIGLGVGPDDRVAICVERSLEMVVGLLGILKAGGAYVPLDPSYPAERLAYMLLDSAPVALLTQVAVRESLPAVKVPLIVLDGEQDLSTLTKQPDHNPDPPTLGGLNSHHLAYVIYTSGSTGTPKGVMVEHANVVHQVVTHCRTYELSCTDRALQFASFGFDSSVVEMFPAFAVGATIVLRPVYLRTPDNAFVAFLQASRITLLDLPTAFWHQWAQEIRCKNSLPGTTLRLLVVGGEKAEQRRLSNWFGESSTHGCLWVNTYGPAETTIYTTSIAFDNQTPLPNREIPIGRPIANTQIYILDDYGQPVPVGVTGELYIGGVQVARGYLNRPELTAERFIADPFGADPDARMYKTGDLGRWLADGNIEYLGRNDFQVKIRGFRIELGEIEAKLAEHEGVREAVVIAREDSPGQKHLVAYVVVQAGVKLSAAELRSHLAGLLPEYMVPSAFVNLEGLPLTPNGKLDRRALPAPGLDAVVTRRYEAPQGVVETAIARVWQELLNLDRVGRHDHFFELGGHSLMVISLIERLRQQGISADVRTVFSAPTLAALATAVVKREGLAPALVVPPNRITIDCATLTPEMLPLVSLSQGEIDQIVASVPRGVANIQDIYPLGPLQEGILFHHLLESEGDAYIMRSVMEFDSRTRLDGFLSALQAVIDRHDILRSAVRWQGLVRPVQVVYREATLPVQELSLSGEDDALSQLLGRTDPRRLRLDLERAPLLAAYVAADAHSGQWLLALLSHHMVSDHVTLELIVAEIQILLQGQSERLPLPLPYRNFIAQVQAISAQEHETYFRQQLGDVDEPTAPFGVLNIQGDGGPVEEANIALSEELAKRIRESARQQGVTPAVLFHIAWGQVLAQCSGGRDDVVFGTVLSGRLQGSEGADRVLGMFINTLPIRIPLAGVSVREAVRDTYQRLSELLEHEQASLALAQRCSGVAPPLPLFTALLNYRHSYAATPDLSWEGMRVSVEKSALIIRLLSQWMIWDKVLV